MHSLALDLQRPNTTDNFGEAAGIASVMDKTIDTSKSLYILFCIGGLTVNYNEVNQESIHFLFLDELHSTVVPSKTVEVDLSCQMPVC